MTHLAAPPPDDGTCDCCGCDTAAHPATASLWGAVLFAALLAALIGLALVVRGAVKDPDTAAHGEPR